AAHWGKRQFPSDRDNGRTERWLLCVNSGRGLEAFEFFRPRRIGGRGGGKVGLGAIDIAQGLFAETAAIERGWPEFEGSSVVDQMVEGRLRSSEAAFLKHFDAQSHGEHVWDGPGGATAAVADRGKSRSGRDC